jgi:hypothetical protein
MYEADSLIDHLQTEIQEAMVRAKWLIEASYNSNAAKLELTMAAEKSFRYIDECEKTISRVAPCGRGAGVR